jgi:RNA polymerase sigma-70 factor, ECF subfamily
MAQEPRSASGVKPNMRPLAHTDGAAALGLPPRPVEGRWVDQCPDSALVRSAREGDVAACQELIRRYQDRIYAVAYGYVQNREEALDITQDTFLRMLEGLPRFREQANFYTWLYRIAVNRCIDWRRTRTRRPPPVSLDELVMDGGTELSVSGAAVHPQAALETKELREQIRAAIARVPEVYRIVMVLADLQGLSNGEIAAILGCPINTVKSRLHRGRLFVRDRLEPYLKGEDYDLS